MKHSCSRHGRLLALLCLSLAADPGDVARVFFGTDPAYRVASGMKPTVVCNQPPQLQPPPPSAASTIPQAGTALIQQSGLSLSHVLTLPLVPSHIVKPLFR